jgi:2-methylcitrate synthase
MAEAPLKQGLEDFVSTDSSICYIDGESGILAYRGIDIHDLARKSSFEEVCFLLWEGRLPRRDELESVRAEIGRNRTLPPEVLKLLRRLAGRPVPIHHLRTAVSALSATDPDARDSSPNGNRRKAVRLTGQMATIVAALHRLRQGRPLIPPDPGRTHADDLLRMLNGETARSAAVQALDTALVLRADHELSTSTLAARSTAATRADIHATITAALAAAGGPLHGGASERVLQMLFEIGSPERAEEWLTERLARAEGIVGFGHRIYRTEDPRATHVREMSRRIGESLGDSLWYDLSRRIEQVVKEAKGLKCNADFYSASLYHLLGFPPDLFAPLFAVSRIAGWTAHVLEQYARSRLIRPPVAYTGPPYPQPYLTIEARHHSDTSARRQR